jgi:uncharacterized OsmC-like protein
MQLEICDGKYKLLKFKKMKTLLQSQMTKNLIVTVILLSEAINMGIARINMNLAVLNSKETATIENVVAEEEDYSPTRINGFSMDDIMGTVNAIQADPEIARFEFRVKNKWIDGGHNRSWIQDFYGGGQEDQSRMVPFVHDNSEPPILLGNNEGANPVEYILHGLAGCMTTTMVLHAAANGIMLTSVESRLEGDLDVQGFLGLNDKVRNGYQNIRVSFTIKGNLTDAEKQMLESFVQKSPVFDIVTNSVPVSISLNY